MPRFSHALASVDKFLPEILVAFAFSYCRKIYDVMEYQVVPAWHFNLYLLDMRPVQKFFSSLSVIVCFLERCR